MIRAPEFCELNLVGWALSWMDTKPSSPRAQFARRGQRSDQVLRTLKTLPHRFVKHCPNSTSPPARRQNEAPNSAKSSRRLGSVTRSPSGTYSLALANRSAAPFSTVWQLSSRLPPESRAMAFLASIKRCWICGGTSWGWETLRCGALGNAPGLKPKAGEPRLGQNDRLGSASQELLTVVHFTKLARKAPDFRPGI